VKVHRMVSLPLNMIGQFEKCNALIG